MKDEGWSHVILDGKVITTDQLRVKTTSKKGKTIDAWYSGKTHGFGGNIHGLGVRRRAGLGPRPDRSIVGRSPLITSWSA